MFNSFLSFSNSDLGLFYILHVFLCVFFCVSSTSYNFPVSCRHISRACFQCKGMLLFSFICSLSCWSFWWEISFAELASGKAGRIVFLDWAMLKSSFLSHFYAVLKIWPYISHGFLFFSSLFFCFCFFFWNHPFLYLLFLHWRSFLACLQ